MILGRIRTQLPFKLQEIDINQDMKLSKLYGESIPVILVDGREACRGRVEERKIRELIQAKTNEISSSH